MAEVSLVVALAVAGGAIRSDVRCVEANIIFQLSKPNPAVPLVVADDQGPFCP